MGGSDGDTQYKLSSEPPDTQICDGILFTPRRGQASHTDHDLYKIVCLISQQN